MVRNENAIFSIQLYYICKSQRNSFLKFGLCENLSAAQPGECLKIVQMSLFPYFLHVVAARYTQRQKQKMPGSQTSVVAAKVNRRQLPARSHGEREEKNNNVLQWQSLGIYFLYPSANPNANTLGTR